MQIAKDFFPGGGGGGGGEFPLPTTKPVYTPVIQLRDRSYWVLNWKKKKLYFVGSYMK